MCFIVFAGPVVPFALPSAPSEVAVLWYLRWESGRMDFVIEAGGTRALRRARPTLDLHAIVKNGNLELNCRCCEDLGDFIAPTSPSSKVGILSAFRQPCQE